MKKRSLPALILLDIATLGLYELYWLYKTRNEMVVKLGKSIPGGWWLLLAKTIQIGCVLLTVYAVLYAIPTNNRRIDNLTRPSAACFGEYAHSSDSVRAGGQETVSQNCKNQVDEYFKGDNSINLLEIVLGFYVVSFVLLWLTLKRWYVPYAEAIAKVTRQKLNSTYAMVLLVVVPSPFGMLSIQNILNKV